MAADIGDGQGGDGSDRTVIRPNPGGRRPEPAGGAARPAAPAAAQPAAPGPAAAPLVGMPDQVIAGLRGSGANPLIDASIALLALIHRLRNTAQHADVAGLHRQLVQQIGEFERTARELGESPETVNAARYCLCTALDEAVLTTPWGAGSMWNSQSLLATFHKETWGGDKLFRVLENLMQNPGANLNLLELLYVLLCLGFEGKYRVMERGEARLEELRMSVFERLRPYRGEFERELSPAWRGVGAVSRRSRRPVPLWVIAAMVAAVVVSSHAVMSYVLSQSSEPVRAKLVSIGNAPAATR